MHICTVELRNSIESEYMLAVLVLFHPVNAYIFALSEGSLSVQTSTYYSKV